MEIELLQTMDATKWAKSFVEMYPQMDEEVMHSWFANAIMCGWDHHSWQTDKAPTWIYLIDGIPVEVTDVYEDREAVVKKFPVGTSTTGTTTRTHELYEHTKHVITEDKFTLNQICKYNPETGEWNPIASRFHKVDKSSIATIPDGYELNCLDSDQSVCSVVYAGTGDQRLIREK